MVVWKAEGLGEAERIAFEWSRFPTVQSFEPGDGNQGMAPVPAEARARFDLQVRRSFQDECRTVVPEGVAVRRRESRLRGWLIALCLAAVPMAATAAEVTGLSLLPQRAAAPAIALDNLEGGRTDLAALRGRVVLVNFWATWCPPCRREMPSMERLRRVLEGEDFTVLAVNVGEAEDSVFAFAGQLEPAPAFTILLDRASDVLRAWPVKGLPTTFVVDRQGRLAARAVGGREFDDPGIVQEIRRLLAEGSGETPARPPEQRAETP